MTEIIGRGERVCLSILKSLHPEAEFVTQYPLSKLVDEEWGLSERQEKETLDIVYFLDDKTYVVRVQDPHHDGMGMQRVDHVQKKTLEFYGCIVIDVWYSDCPNIFNDKNDSLSISELKAVYKENGISI